MTTLALVLACLALAGWLYLAFLHGDFWRPLLDKPDAPAPALWPSIDIIVPARNEADILPQTLPSLLTQDYPGPWRVILVDDHSRDGTGKVARQLADQLNLAHRLLVINAPDLPEGWSGKVAAMNTGVGFSISEYLLFTDADIMHPRDSLRRLASRAIAERLDLVSLMVKLNTAAAVEKFLIPAFVFFFAMLYPFRRANDEASGVAAAAGGVAFVRKEALKNIGGLARIKSALIDDCSLAAAIKKDGGPSGSNGHIRLSLTQDTVSLRSYPFLEDVWQMVARTAFTQLRFSALLLIGTCLGMGLLFFVPLLALLTGWPMVSEIGFATWVVMTVLYLPTIRFYKLSPLWSLTLSMAAALYVGATIDSAKQYWQGKGGKWKDRNQAIAP